MNMSIHHFLNGAAKLLNVFEVKMESVMTLCSYTLIVSTETMIKNVSRF